MRGKGFCGFAVATDKLLFDKELMYGSGLEHKIAFLQLETPQDHSQVQ